MTASCDSMDGVPFRTCLRATDRDALTPPIPCGRKESEDYNELIELIPFFMETSLIPALYLKRIQRNIINICSNFRKIIDYMKLSLKNKLNTTFINE